MYFKAPLIFSILLYCTIFFAQQTPHFSQYNYNMQIFNPAAVGSRSDMSVSLLSRSQWVGVDGAPTTQTFSFNIRTKKGLAIGTTLVRDEIGLVNSTNANFDLSYTLVTAEYRRLAFGLKGGYTFFNNNLANGITPDNDVYASTSGQYPNIGFGIFYYTKKYFFGLSVPYLLKTPEFNIETSDISELSNNINYFITGGYKFKLNRDFWFKPTTMLKYISTLPLTIDVNANFLYKEFIESGISYRNDKTLSVFTALILKKKYRLGYSYEHKFTNFSANLNTHEIVLHIDFDLKRQSRWLVNDTCYF